MIDWFEQLTLLAIALAANILSSIAGGGAGLLQLPALILLGLPFSMALATHKIATVALGLGASVRHYREKNTELSFSLYILLWGLPGVIAGTQIILKVPEQSATMALGMLTLSMGTYSIYKKNLGQVYSPKHRDTRGIMIGGVVLFSIGVLNGSLTSGTGLFVTLWLIAWFGLDYKRAIAYTMILVGLFWNGTGALALVLQTPVKWTWLPVLLVSATLGGYAGAGLALRYGNPLIKRMFEGVTIVLGVVLIARAWGLFEQ